MAPKKKTYTKPRLVSRKIKIGVYGDYQDNGDWLEPTTPVFGKDLRDGRNLVD